MTSEQSSTTEDVVKKEPEEKKTQMQRLRSWILVHDDKTSFIVAYIGIAVVLSTFVSLFWLLLIVLIHFIFECIKENDGVLTRSQIFSRAMWELKLDLTLIFFAFLIDVYMDSFIILMGLSDGSRADDIAYAGAASARACSMSARAGSGAARLSAGAARAGSSAARVGSSAARAGSAAARASSSAARAASTGARVAQTSTRLVVIQRSIRAVLMLLDEAVLVLRGIFMGKGKKESDEDNENKDSQAEVSKKDTEQETTQSPTEKTEDEQIKEEAQPKEEEDGDEEQPKDDNMSPWGGWVMPWTKLDTFIIVFGVICFALLVAAPWLGHYQNYGELMKTIAEELHPWPLWPLA